MQCSCCCLNTSAAIASAEGMTSAAKFDFLTLWTFRVKDLQKDCPMPNSDSAVATRTARATIAKILEADVGGVVRAAMTTDN
jgi:hypothetical protein